MQQQQHETLANTFRGAGGGNTRRTFFGKTDGQAELQRDMLMVASPVSGCVLTAPDAARQAAIKDPISGTTLHLSGNHADIITPVLKQHQVHAKNFYLSKDIDIQIALLRQTNTVNQHTNEKDLEEDISGGLHIGGCIITEAPLSNRRSSQHAIPPAAYGSHTSAHVFEPRQNHQSEEYTTDIQQQQQLLLLQALQREDDSDASLDEDLQDYLSNIQKHAETPGSNSEDGEDEQAQDSGGSGDSWWLTHRRPGLGFNASSATALRFAGSSLEHALQGLLGQDLEASGARNGQLLPGEKKRLRKEKIAAKRATRAAERGLSALGLLSEIDDFAAKGHDMMMLPPCGKHKQSFARSLAALYGVRATAQGGSSSGRTALAQHYTVHEGLGLWQLGLGLGPEGVPALPGVHTRATGDAAAGIWNAPVVMSYTAAAGAGASCDSSEKLSDASFLKSLLLLDSSGGGESGAKESAAGVIPDDSHVTSAPDTLPDRQRQQDAEMASCSSWVTEPATWTSTAAQTWPIGVSTAAAAPAASEPADHGFALQVEDCAAVPVYYRSPVGLGLPVLDEQCAAGSEEEQQQQQQLDHQALSQSNPAARAAAGQWPPCPGRTTVGSGSCDKQKEEQEQEEVEVEEQDVLHVVMTWVLLVLLALAAEVVAQLVQLLEDLRLTPQALALG
eukprot:gene7013-7227_t